MAAWQAQFWENYVFRPCALSAEPFRKQHREK